ncbi:phosphoribosylglycinamide formyltransferase [Pseudochrobactrum kiredjianiae]|uniref:Phosphoribosylglycinamide formyltransferase n=1 Tax=Pseudochrobactrum kiredjianiae TaxID=386305 RepID=A0ABW3VBD6_9HYPH|nr:phosphoribosylglycinamide formyltransferase [Pseudochrobactrum kiredjianiae]MDM7851579.1 phosphoribosylglycinamide formyltransferase [Pseudochrobactrum kiredjianiae]
MSPTSATPRKRVVIFISGGGSNMETLIRAAQAPDYPAEIVAVFSDKHDAGGLVKAQTAGITTYVHARKDYSSKQAHEDAILEQLAQIAPDIICLAGYMRLLSGRFIAPFAGRILNIHPSLLPLFPGLHTHQRALDAGMKLAGCTVHLVTEGMDEGPILAQGAVAIHNSDTADTLAARVLIAEHQLYPLALHNFAADMKPEKHDNLATQVLISV